MVHPIIDEYYSHSPYHSRSSKYVQDKGLVTNEKGTLGTSPSTTPGNPTTKPTSISSSLRDSIASTLVPPTRSSLSASALSPAVENATSTDQRTSLLQQIQHSETHNTKKKRISITAREHVDPEPDSPAEPPIMPPLRKASYGDPNKIAQYFPELHTTGAF